MAIQPPDVIDTPNIKPGIKTSEGILTILATLASLIGQYQGLIPAPWGTVAAAVVTAVYTIARTYIKAQALKGGTNGLSRLTRN